MISTHLVCGGAGPVTGAGLARVGELFDVSPAGDLRWYRYDGTGEASPDGSLGWSPNSGNAIATGWDTPKFLCGGGDGVLFAVKANGDLIWHRYIGDGSAGAPPGTGWAPKSGNPIGRGWAGFLSLVCTPKSFLAVTNSGSTLFAVRTDGNLLWYRYVGDGTADQTGGTGWAAKSGNPIGRGWQNFKILTAAADVLFGVEQNGDLRWYSYRGDGTADATGGTGWHPNSRNIIARGWHRFERVVGGPDDHGGAGIALYAVEPDGTMYWYKYLGHGEPDVTGTTGWHPRSGTRIGRGWFSPAVLTELHRLPHDKPVNAVAFAGDGLSVATGSDDHTARVFAVAGGAERSRLAHDGPVTAVVWAGATPLVGSASADRSVRLFDPATGAERARVDHDGAVQILVPSPDGQRLASAGADGVVRLIDVPSGAVVRRLTHNAPVTALAFGPGGMRIATAADDDTARVFNTVTGVELLTLPHEVEIRALAVSPDGLRLVTATADGAVRTFDTTNGAQVLSLAGLAANNAVVFSPDGRRIALAGDDGVARVLDAATGTRLHQFAHDGPVRALAFTPDNAVLATASSDRTARLWLTAGAGLLCSYPHDGPVVALSVHPDGTLLATAGTDARIYRIPR